MENFKCVSHLWIDDVKAEMHFFDLPREGKGSYVAIESYNRFHVREAKRSSKAAYETGEILHKRCHVQIIDDAIFPIKMASETPKFFHETIWDMYKAVGYDYKKKKYITDSEELEKLRKRQPR